jgi:endonuclease III related protein
MATTNTRRKVERVYELLYDEYGSQHWWPADTPFEVCIGAILTQSTSWTNVEKAIANLKAAGLLSPGGLRAARPARIAGLIRPSLYYNVKARKLKEFVGFLYRGYGGRVESMADVPLDALRVELLGVWGLGPETVDSILLYALDKQSFVVDAYTKRIFSRLGLAAEDAGYDDLKRLFEDNLCGASRLYNEYHALIVEHGKNTCKPKPICGACHLRRLCDSASFYLSGSKV